MVPNPTLLDNHQVEFAEVMANMGYVVHGHLEYCSLRLRYQFPADDSPSNLEKALADSEALRKKSKEWPPVNSGVHRQAKGLAGIVDEEMGYLD